MAIGFSSTYFGMGGGFLLVPLLPWVVPISIREAVGTSHLTVLVVAAFNTIQFHQRGLVEWPMVWRLGPIAAVSGFLAGRFSKYVPASAVLSCLLVILVWLVVKTLSGISGLRADKTPHGIGSCSVVNNFSFFSKILKNENAQLFTLATIAGALVGFTGVGFGLIMTPLLLAVQRMADQKAAPTANALMVFTSLLATLSYLQLPGDSEVSKWEIGLGAIHPRIALMVFVGTLSTSWIGHRYQHFMSVFLRRAILAVLLIILIGRVSCLLFSS